jgi:hypothetical protein
MPTNPALEAPCVAALPDVAVLTKVRVVPILVSGHLGVSAASSLYRDCLQSVVRRSLGRANGCTPVLGPKGKTVGIGQAEEKR